MRPSHGGFGARMRAAALALALGTAVACDGSSTPTGPSAGSGSGGGGPVSTGQTASIVAVGDVGWCGLDGTRSTAQLVESLPGSILLAGDLAYPSGRLVDFQNCFDPHYGRFRPRLRPAPGNHDYDVPGAAGYLQYFGSAATPSGLTYYTLIEGDWLVLMLDSNIPAGPGSPQYEFARTTLEARRGGCAMAVWHHPAFTSGQNGPNPFMRPMFQLLYANGVEVNVVGHDHVYERFAPQDADGRPDPVRGVRQFTVGTGGAALYRFVTTAPNSETRITAFGVLRMTLRPNSYEWGFLGTDGVVADSGLNVCH